MTGVLNLANISCRYGNLTTLDRFCLTARAGGRHAVIGAHGAGKSTLLGVIAGTRRPPTGHIHFAGGGPGCRRLRAALGQLFDDLVAEGVKSDDLYRVGDPLQDPQVTVNGRVVVSTRGRRPCAPRWGNCSTTWSPRV